MFSMHRPAVSAITSSSSGTRSAAKRGANQLPASSFLISSTVRSRTGPLPFVVRSSVSSWMTTTRRSRVRVTSSSIMSQPASMAPVNAARVFSGYRAG